MVSIDGTNITGATIDGQQVSEIAIDGQTAWTAIPDSAVFDDWADSKLTNREDFNTTPYSFNSINGGVNNTRPEWSNQYVSGTLAANNGHVDIYWDSGSPVTYLGSSDTDLSHVYNLSSGEKAVWYAEVKLVSTSNASRIIWHIMTGDANDRGAQNYISLTLRERESEVYIMKNVSGSISNIVTASQNLPVGTYYGILVTLDSSGTWEIYYNPSDPKNPQQSELIATATDSYLPNVGTSGGVAWTVGNDIRYYVRRTEITKV